MVLQATDCYNLLSQIPRGKVTTYGEIARKLDSKAYRAVGTLIGKNPNAPEVPCHRVVKSDGSVGGYAFGVEKKLQLLNFEGIEVIDGKIKNFKDLIHKF